MKASDYIVEFLKQQNISKVFGYIGGMIAHITDSIYTSDSIEMINTINEQGAGFAAEGYARSTGNVSVAIATSGPGATNLLTPMASCFFDATPVVFITGQVNTFEYKRYPQIRQTGFQETDIVAMAKPITKYATIINDIKNLKYELEKAFFIAQNGYKGPVLLDIPMDIQRTDYDFVTAKSFIPQQMREISRNIDNIIELLKLSKKPLVLAGNGVRLADASQDLKDFLNKTHIPIVESLLGLDSVTSDYLYNLGMIGTYGNRYANIALSLADTILVLGSRLDIRQIGANVNIFKDKTIIQVDINTSQLECDNLKKITFHSSTKDFLSKLNKKILNLDISQWQEKVLSLKNRFPSTKNINAKLNIPNLLIQQLSQILKEDDIVCTDVGQHQMWVGQSVVIKANTRHLTSGGLGCMGFSLPVAIGSSLSGHRCIVITGDGGFQMNIQELEVVKRRKLPIKIVVMNNHSLGMVRQFQDLYFEGRNASTVEDYSVPDFALIAKAYKIKSQNIKSKDINEQVFKKFLKDDKPALINIIFEEKTQIIPKVLFGNTIDNMHPLLTEAELNEIKR